MSDPGSRRQGIESDPVVIGKPSEISINAINKNLANEDSTLTYRYPDLHARRHPAPAQRRGLVRRARSAG